MLLLQPVNQLTFHNALAVISQPQLTSLADATLSSVSTKQEETTVKATITNHNSHSERINLAFAETSATLQPEHGAGAATAQDANQLLTAILL